jgi:serine/threonine protein kinase
LTTLMSRTIGQYEIGTTLGKGMSAKVKLGRDVHTGELVALKIIDKSRPNDRQMELLNREITAMKSLSHQNILKLEFVNMDGMYPRKCGLNRSCILLALEYAPNGELFDFLMFSGAFPENVSRTYFSQLISALEACHARGIYHRDIKPENLLLDANFQLKVADFGLSSINDPEQDPTNPLRTECGTKSYMPPEMLMHWPYHGSQADIWSSLVVLFIMLSGNPPFQLANVQDWWFKQIASNKRDRFWRAHLKSSPFFPQSAQEFIDRSLIPDPRRRPTIDDLKNDIWMQQEILS